METLADFDNIKRSTKSERSFHTIAQNEAQVIAQLSREKKHVENSTSQTSTASSVKVATVKTTPNNPSIAKVIAWASLATKTAAFDASLSKLHSIPAKRSYCSVPVWDY